MILINSLKLILVLMVVFLLAVLGACASTPPVSITVDSVSDSVRIVISRDFGRTIVSDKIVEIKKKSNAMSALQQAAQVETSYGGSFVEGIDGLRSEYSGVKSNKQDWFYYVNGLVANTGALEYPLHNGDIVQWDFHNWEYRQLVPAMIGHFPQPFLSGSRGKIFPTLVVYQEGWDKQAGDIQRYLKESGVEKVEIRLSEQLSDAEKATHNLIIVAGQQNQLVSDLNKEWKRLGFSAYFESADLVTIDSKGKIKSRFQNGTGFIQATQNPWNPNGIGADENTVWVISGCDQIGINSAVECLIQKPGDWQCSYGVITQRGEIIKMP